MIENLFDLQGKYGFIISRLTNRLMRKEKSEGGEWGKYEKGKMILEDQNELAEKDYNSKHKGK